MPELAGFNAVRIGIASPEDVKRWSHGEVKKPETINYRNFKPEPEGLFCERIFGPVRDYQCHCGKYKKIKFKGIICDRCGVEVTTSKVRRRRMGHIDLAAPVCHIWYLRNTPSPIALLLGLSPKEAEQVIYFGKYIVTHVDRRRINASMERIRWAVEEDVKEIQRLEEEAIATVRRRYEEQMAEEGMTEEEKARWRKQMEERIKREEELFEGEVMRLKKGLEVLEGLYKKQLVSEEDYRALQKVTEAINRRLGKGFENLWRAGMGAEAIRDLLAEIDLEQSARELKREIKETEGPRRVKAVKRLRMVEAFRKSKNRPEWMILEVLPVMPPDLRPMVQLDGGRFATSDLNDLYRRIINRNNRLKRILQLRAPETIVNHEKRLLQEAVDALIDNSRRKPRPVLGTRRRPLKSLSEILKGKQGRFRRNLLGKRVDYSARAVIVPGPELKLHQCGIPKEVALEIFKPFVIERLVRRGVVSNTKTARRFIDKKTPEVWEALEEVIEGRYVLLNRAPTLHRLSIQAFEPVLVEGKAIKIHPLVCPPFNADFDGDAMAVHLPLSWSAQAEARLLMLSFRNIFSPASGRLLSAPTQDMVLGCYFLTQRTERKPARKVKSFSSPDEAILAYEEGCLDLHEWIRVKANGMMLITTVGRLIFNRILPEDMRYKSYLNKVITKKEVAQIASECFKRHGWERTAKLLDEVKELGFKVATKAGFTISAQDLELPTERDQIFTSTETAVVKATEEMQKGRISEGERKRLVVTYWGKAYEDVTKAVQSSVSRFNPVYMMIASGARGSTTHLVQLMGTRGLMRDAQDRLIEDLPIRSNLLEGHTILEYFVSTYGARKGLADTAVRTAFAGYLTRRLVDVAQEVIVRERDCKTVNGIEIKEIPEVLSLEERIRGRVAAEDILDPYTGKVIVRRDEEIEGEKVVLLQRINCKMKEEGKGPFKVKIRSPLTCETPRGVCSLCYGRDLSMDRLVEVGEAVGIVAAQSIGEPGTQLTLRTFHFGGVVGAGELVTATRYGHGEIAAREEAVRQTLSRVAYSLRLRAVPEEALAPIREVAEVTEPLEYVSELEEAPLLARPVVVSLPQWELPPEVREGALDRILKARMESLRKQLAEERELLNRGLRPPLGGLPRVEELFEARATPPVGAGVMTEIRGFVAYIGQAVDTVSDISVVEVETVLSLDDPIFSEVTNLVAAEPVVDLESGEVLVWPYMSVTDGVRSLLKARGVKRLKVRKLYLIPVPEHAATLDRLRRAVKVEEASEDRTLLEDAVGKGGEVVALKGARLPDELREKLLEAGVEKVVVGAEVNAGDVLCEGPLPLHQILRLRGLRGLQEYLLDEFQREYRLQGADINDKHFEVIMRQMLRKVKVKDPGDTEFLPGDIVDRFTFQEENRRVKDKGGKGAVAEPLILGIKTAALATESFLAAASFEMTTRVLTEASCSGKHDPLVGLKENVIIGRLIPAGTGFEEHASMTIKPLIGASAEAEVEEQEELEIP